MKPTLSVSILAVATGIIATTSCRFRSRTADEVRYDMDTSFFTGVNAYQPPILQETIKKTAAYQQYRKTQVADSVFIYLKQAENEAVKILNIKN